jgi:aryl-alcohol dehydrogenase-like predicted oxidoreductase
MTPDHHFKDGDHRTYRPQGWVGHGLDKVAQMQPIIDKHGLTLLQFASLWNLAHEAVQSVVPTFIQEAGDDARPVEDLLTEFAEMPADNPLTPEEVEQIANIGDNTGCMPLKGASKRHEVSERPDEWPMRDDLLELAGRHGLGEEW